MYTIFRRNESGELTAVAATDHRAHAERLAHSLNKLWPAEYKIKESPGQEKDA